MKARRTLAVVFAVCLMPVAVAGAATKGKTSSVEEAVKAQQAEIENLKKEVDELKSTKPKSGLSGYDGGFFIKSADDLYSFKVRLFSQFYYEYDMNEDAADGNSFGIRRARLLLSGNTFSKNLTYMLMAEMATQYGATISQTAYTVVDSGGDTSTFTVTDTTNNNFRLLYLWAQYRFADEFQIRIGEFIPPTEYFFRASNLLEFGDFPIIATANPFTPNFHTGIDLLGTVAKKFDYEVFAVNASNLDRVNLNKSFRVGACLTYNFLGKPSLGVADIDYSNTPQLALTMSGAYETSDYTYAAPVSINSGDTLVRGQTNLVFRYKGFSFVPEFIVIYDATQHFRDYAAAVQTGYFITPKHLELAAQMNYLGYAGPQNDLYEISGGLNYYFFGQPLKLQLDYSYLISRLAGDDRNNHRIRLGLQAGFF